MNVMGIKLQREKRQGNLDNCNGKVKRKHNRNLESCANGSFDSTGSLKECTECELEKIVKGETSEKVRRLW